MSAFSLRISTPKKQNLELILQRLSEIELKHETSDYWLIKVLWLYGEMGLEFSGWYVSNFRILFKKRIIS